MKSFVGDFLVQTTDAVTDTIAITGLGFTPKALILFWTGRDDASNAAGRSDAFPGVAYVGGTTSRVMSSGKMEDAVGTTDTARYARDDAIVGLIGPGDGEDGLLDLSSFDADGFTVVVDQVFGIDLRIQFLALGGDDLLNVFTGEFLQPAAPGNQSVTGVGFTPSLCMWTGVASGGGLPLGPGGNHQLVWGGMIDGTQQGSTSAAAGNGDGTTSSARHSRNGDQAHASTADGGAVNARFEFVSMDADGFTVDHIEADNDRTLFMCLEIEDDAVAMGDLLTTTNPDSIVVTGVGFKPAAVYFFSANNAENGEDASTADAIMSVGAATSPTNRGACCYQDRDGLGTSEDSTAINFDQVYLRLSTGASPVIVGSMDLTSMDPDGFTCFMDDPEPSPAPGAAFVQWIAIGEAEPDPIDQGVSGKWRWRRQQLPVKGGIRT